LKDFPMIHTLITADLGDNMTWKMILKKMDYNQLSDYEKKNIFYEMVGDGAHEEIGLDDFIRTYYDTEGYSTMPKEFAFPEDDFRLLALGGMEIYGDEDEGRIEGEFHIYVESRKKRITPREPTAGMFDDVDKESYYIGRIAFDLDQNDYKMNEDDEDWDFETNVSFFDFMEFSNYEVYMELADFSEFTRGVDYNKLVSYLKKAGKWDEEDMASSMKTKPAKVSHRQEVNEWLEEAEDYATQKFEQSYSPQDDASIEDAQDFYKLLEYLETTNEDDWDENKMRRDFGAAMTIVSETLGGLP
jgi:hypothetical protein